MEEGPSVGTLVCYVAQVLSIMDDGKMSASYLRMKSGLLKDTFTFPNIPDVYTVEPQQFKGVLVVKTAGTKRQANIIKVFPPLSAFNMHK